MNLGSEAPMDGGAQRSKGSSGFLEALEPRKRFADHGEPKLELLLCVNFQWDLSSPQFL
jgi:hypothetical protein